MKCARLPMMRILQLQVWAGWFIRMFSQKSVFARLQTEWEVHQHHQREGLLQKVVLANPASLQGMSLHRWLLRLIVRQSLTQWLWTICSSHISHNRKATEDKISGSVKASWHKDLPWICTREHSSIKSCQETQISKWFFRKAMHCPRVTKLPKVRADSCSKIVDAPNWSVLEHAILEQQRDTTAVASSPDAISILLQRLAIQDPMTHQCCLKTMQYNQLCWNFYAVPASATTTPVAMHQINTKFHQKI